MNRQSEVGRARTLRVERYYTEEAARRQMGETLRRAHPLTPDKELAGLSRTADAVDRRTVTVRVRAIPAHTRYKEYNLRERTTVWRETGATTTYAVEQIGYTFEQVPMDTDV